MGSEDKKCFEVAEEKSMPCNILYFLVSDTTNKAANSSAEDFCAHTRITVQHPPATSDCRGIMENFYLFFLGSPWQFPAVQEIRNHAWVLFTTSFITLAAQHNYVLSNMIVVYQFIAFNWNNSVYLLQCTAETKEPK